MNDVRFTGRLVRDPEMRTTSSGLSVCNFDLAVRRRFSKEGETDFIHCVAWRQTAEYISKYFSKGSGILVAGELHQKKYTDKEGNARTDYEVVINDAEFFGSKSDSGEHEKRDSGKTAPSKKNDPEPDDADDSEDDGEEELPF